MPDEPGIPPQAAFASRHIGPREAEIEAMLASLGLDSLEALAERALPRAIRTAGPLHLPPPRTDSEVLAELRELAGRNQLYRSFIGLGFHETVLPPPIRRGILENPGWYTAYTPYQAEISQGRLEALLNFQTMIADLTALPIANASLLDEASAAAEALALCHRVAASRTRGARFVVSSGCHPQTIAVVETRARALGIEVAVGDLAQGEIPPGAFGVLLAYPETDGAVRDWSALCERAHARGALVAVVADPLALTLLRPPGEFGADVAVGSTQRFGVPLGFGGPHAAYIAVRERFVRHLPGRIVGVSRDAAGQPALRLALQTREQHIRREKATSNICTAQVLPAILASMYAVYHGPEGLERIARRLHRLAGVLAEGLREIGCRVEPTWFFDTLRVSPGPRDARQILAAAEARRFNLRLYDDGSFGIALGEPTTEEDIAALLEIFGAAAPPDVLARRRARAQDRIPPELQRTSRFLTDPVFHRYRAETELVRYMHRLEARDLALNTSMIPLGSCTMKLNAAAEMLSITEAGFAELHPFAPAEQAEGYAALFERLRAWFGEITGLPAVTLMPNAGAQGEYTGLLVIRAYHEARGEGQRDVCLIPQSAHGTNPASAAMSGLQVVTVRCDAEGNVDVADLEARAREHARRLAALMVTYPSTHGVFEERIAEICEIVHRYGGQVYLDGANMNALVGLARAGEFGADICHLNLHKTFCIPHGGGGPGVGPVCAAAHLAPYLPRHPLRPEVGGPAGIGPVAAAPYGSPGVLPIAYAYLAMMGSEGLRRASLVAILAANYVARRLEPHYRILYKGRHGLVAHECLVDVRPFRRSAQVEAEDIAKRLMDYGFHAPTMSFPVAGTLMIEPTESESKAELDRFCEAMLAIREEIREIEEGRADPRNNLLKNAPHTAQAVCAEPWDRPYPRERAAFPAAWLREHKYWPPVARVDNAYGDRHLVCRRGAGEISLAAPEEPPGRRVGSG